MFKNKKGFTLIELLVVIAVLGVLATVVIAAINPFQQLMKGRDSANVQSGLCYTGPTAAAPTNPFIIFAKMEATLNISKCGGTMTTAWAVFSSAAGRGGVVCTTGGDPVSSDAYGNCAASPCTAADQFTQ